MSVPNTTLYPFDVTHYMKIDKLELNRANYTLYIQVSHLQSKKPVAEIMVQFHYKESGIWRLKTNIESHCGNITKKALEDIRYFVEEAAINIMDRLTDRWGLFSCGF